jgi:Domain of unknown function (DUF4160)
MPRVSAFFGIVIYMYYNDHLPPHFHAEYAEHEAIYEIDTLMLLAVDFHVALMHWCLNGQLCTVMNSARIGNVRARKSL